jgi:putative transposase
MPLVRDLAAEGIPVVVTCEVLGFSPQAFYKWQARPYSDRDWDDAVLMNAIVDVHADDPEFGYRFIADELEAAGHRASENRVHRLCREHRVWSTTTKKGRKGAGKRPGPAAHDDLVQRNFTAPDIDQVWLTDISEHPTSEGKLYVCAIKDVCSRRIVGYSIGDRMTAQLATRALRSAVARRQPKRVVVVHSDRGGQGELNRRSQHLDDGGVEWGSGTSSRPSGCIGGRFPRRDGQRSRGARTASGSGRRSHAGSRPRTPQRRPACHPRLRSGGSVTLAG